VRVAFAAAVVVLAALALVLWIDPSVLTGPSPFDLPPLGGRFAGSWVALLAALAGWAAVRDDVDEARLPALGLVLLPGGALVASLRTVSDLEPAGVAATYVGALVALVAIGATALLALGSRSPSTSPSSSVSARS
jgi:hypothetical protein